MCDDIKSNRTITIIIIGAMFTVGFFLSSGLVVSQATSDPAVDAQPRAIIQSRFILWDSYEKSMDNTFNILLFSWSNTTNNYTITINFDKYNGTFYKYIQLNYTYKNISVISVLTIEINNQTLLHATDIRLFAGITQSGLSTIQEPYKISFLPFELTRFEWNLIFSGLVGTLISLPLAYFTVKYYRKRRGAQVM